jgi:hypothetical protein
MPLCFLFLDLTLEKLRHGVDRHLAANVCDGVGQVDRFGANLNAVLGVAALVNPTLAHHHVQSIALEGTACGVSVEITDLPDHGRPDKRGAIIDLRAGLNAAGAGHAPAEKEMLQQKIPHRNNPGKRMQPTKDKLLKLTIHD